MRLKKLRCRGSGRSAQNGLRQTIGDLVSGRSSCGSARDADTYMGRTGNPAACAAWYTLYVGLYLRRGLSRTRRGCCADHAACGHVRYECTSVRDRQDGRGRCPCLAHPRRCRLARINKTASTRQHHPAQTPALCARTQPDGKRLGLPARQQAGNLCVWILRWVRRQMLRCLEFLRRGQTGNHINYIT